MRLLKWARGFGMFWYDFLVGDDWLLAVGVIFALGVTVLLAYVAKVPSWWLLPIVVVGVIAVSVLRASGKSGRSVAPAPSPAPVADPAEQPAESG